MGAPRNHHALFVETDPVSGGGILLNVTGNIQNGMQFEERSTNKPEESVGFVDQSPLGWVAAGDFDRMRSICERNHPPKKQFNGPKRLYPKEPLRRCQEWTNETIDALTNNGVLQPFPMVTAETPAEEEYWTWSEEYENWYHMHEDGRCEWSTEEQPQNKNGKGKEKGKGEG